jgi:hypothetical protein
VTTLESYLRDQAALFGVLNTLFDLRLSLISRDVTGSAAPVHDRREIPVDTPTNPHRSTASRSAPVPPARLA